MNKKSTTSECGSFSPRLLVVVLLCTGIACSIVTATLSPTAGKLAFLRRDTPAKASQRTLSFAERVSYQRAIEDVYWRHRIWPKERPDPKPSLDAVMSQTQLEKKVEDYLRKSQALEDYWQRPITAEQLQAEMDRMAQHTKQPEVLDELFKALGSDPLVVAECLARPALAERLLTNSHAYDETIHGDLKQRAEADLQAHLPAVASAEAGNTVEQMKQLSGNYSAIELVKSDSSEGATNCGTEHGVKLDSREWDQNVQKLAATFNKASTAELAEFGVRRSRSRGTVFQNTDMSAHSENAAAEDYETVPVGKLSSLQEDENRYYATAVIKKSKNRLTLATVSWVKEPLGSWVAHARDQVPATMAAPGSDYRLPKVVEGGCIDDTWTPTAGPPAARDSHTAVWTGSEMIIWGGRASNFSYVNTGGRYNPSTDSWAATTITNAPSPRESHTGVWTGSEMIIWGGVDFTGMVLKTGGKYNPDADTWIATDIGNAPDAREGHTAVWTGSEMIVWGGYNGTMEVNTGGRYRPGTDSWTATSTTNAPTARGGHTAVWTGREMIVWGGSYNTGGRYNPGTNSWTATSTANAPTGRGNHTAVWTGGEMILWGGYDGTNNLNTGGRYNPGTNSWTATSLTNAPSARTAHTAVWTGNAMIVWGGVDGSFAYTNTGGRYNPSTNSWTASNTTNAPAPRALHRAVWIGNEMIVWGGRGQSFSNLNSGGRYDPDTDSWTNTGTDNVPLARVYHTAVWTGSEMIVWGGLDEENFLSLNTGGRYDPGTDSWLVTSTTNAPSARDGHTAVWTGSEMIVWGGIDDNLNYFNTGGRYNPVTDRWTTTNTGNAPTARASHTAVWNGSEMIVWGGGNLSDYFNTGGRYSPITNSWTTTNTTNAPVAREVHTAVWTGSEMIVWGGEDGTFNVLNTGGRYNTTSNSWLATSTSNAPSARESHTAVWTGDEMIVWGSYQRENTGGRYDPTTDSWLSTTISNAPDGRSGHTAIWTGNDMIIWGGVSFFDSNSGGRYDPAADSWTATSTIGAPDPRESHTAVWTGNEMIVWGGHDTFNGYGFNSGGRYCAPFLGSQLGNISTRAFVQTGDNVVIGGFIVRGSQPKRVIIRAIGPELGAPPYNIPNALANPTLELHDGTGALIASNDNWVTTIIGGVITSNQVHDIQASGYAPGDGRESAIIADLAPGNYTAIVRGVDNMTGVALVEVYDLTADASSILGNISTRSFVQKRDNVMIGGFIVQGTQPKRVIVRAIGPELTQYGIPKALANPTLELHAGNGAKIASNDNWQTTIIGGIITTNQVRDIMNSGYAPGDGRESAIIADLAPGNYTAIVRGVDNLTGIALVEVYDLGQ